MDDLLLTLLHKRGVKDSDIPRLLIALEVVISAIMDIPNIGDADAPLLFGVISDLMLVEGGQVGRC